MRTETGALPEEATGAAFAVDDDRRIVEANDSCVVVFERTLTELTGRRLDDMEVEGFFLDGFVEEFRAAVDAGAAGARTFRTGIRSAGTEDPHTYEVEVGFPDGSDAVTCTLRDVGTRFRYEETVDHLNGATRALMAADSRNEVLARAGDAANEVLGFPGVGVRLYDPEDELLRHVAFGGVVDEIDTRPPYDVHDSPHGQAFLSGETVIEEIPETGDEFDREVFSHTMYVPIGDYGVLSLGRVGGPFDGADVHFAEILADNARSALQQVEREQRLREQRRRLEERNERLDEFASVVSHDLRNPLSVAKGSVEAYRQTGDEEFVDDVADALDRMEGIIDDMLALAREGLTVDDVERISLGGTARAAWRNVDTGDLALRVETDRTLLADRERIQRLLENCYRNAVEHGETATEVVVGEFDGGFYVADDGVGVPPENREAVLDSGYTTATDGTGFGLAIVSRICRAHGFSANVTESETGGARVEVHGDDLFPPE
jgi:signal transduction histidine kinase